MFSLSNIHPLSEFQRGTKRKHKAYRIEISPSAIADIESIFLWIKED